MQNKGKGKRPYHSGGDQEEERRRVQWLPGCSPFLHLPWLALAPKVGMENLQVLVGLGAHCMLAETLSPV